MKGFSILECVLCLALTMTVLSYTTVIGLNSLSIELNNSDANTILTALLHAHAEAVNGVCFAMCSSNWSYGIRISPKVAIVFQGNSYDERNSTSDETFTLSGNSIITGVKEIVFSSISGHIQATTTIFITRAYTASKHITIEEDGSFTTTL